MCKSICCIWLCNVRTSVSHKIHSNHTPHCSSWHLLKQAFNAHAGKRLPFDRLALHLKYSNTKTKNFQHALDQDFCFMLRNSEKIILNGNFKNPAASFSWSKSIPLVFYWILRSTISLEFITQKVRLSILLLTYEKEGVNMHKIDHCFQAFQ